MSLTTTREQRRQLERDPARAAAHLDSAIEGANHAAALIERLLAFARAEPLLPDKVGVDRLIADMEELLARAIGTSIKVVLDLNAGDWSAWADRAQFESALVNMAINARDAMEGRGTLTIATCPVSLRAGEIGQCSAGEHVCLTVTDTGCGMSPEVLERVFEPFFTTKPVGKGTGLGMSQIFGFVGQCRGAIDIRSTPGEGTTIRIVLPRIDGEQAAAAPADTRSDAKFADEQQEDLSLTILVVEDDARVLRSTLSALAALGHRGLACDHPSKAGGMLADHPDIALILSDVLMPDQTGPEMVAELGNQLAQKPVIFVTGFAGDKGTAVQLAGFPLLRKPFTVAQLAGAINEAITTQRGRHEASPAL